MAGCYRTLARAAQESAERKNPRYADTRPGDEPAEEPAGRVSPAQRVRVGVAFMLQRRTLERHLLNLTKADGETEGWPEAQRKAVTSRAQRGW